MGNPSVGQPSTDVASVKFVLRSWPLSVDLTALRDRRRLDMCYSLTLELKFSILPTYVGEPLLELFQILGYFFFVDGPIIRYGIWQRKPLLRSPRRVSVYSAASQASTGSTQTHASLFYVLVSFLPDAWTL